MIVVAGFQYFYEKTNAKHDEKNRQRPASVPGVYMEHSEIHQQKKDSEDNQQSTVNTSAWARALQHPNEAEDNHPDWNQVPQTVNRQEAQVPEKEQCSRDDQEDSEKDARAIRTAPMLSQVPYPVGRVATTARPTRPETTPWRSEWP
jgi:hypothetical protein